MAISSPHWTGEPAVALARRRPRRSTAACTLALLTVLAACSSSRPARVLPPAPEPARAPAPTTAPVGRVLALGDTPEGLAQDPATGLVVVALRRPNRLAFVEGRGGRLLRVVPVEGSARHLTIPTAGASVLVPGEDTDLLVRVRLPTGLVVDSVKVGRQPHDADSSVGRIFVADEFGSSVSVVADGRVIHRFPGPVQPGGVAAAGDRVGVVDVRGAQLFVYDAKALRELARLPAGDGPTHAPSMTRGSPWPTPVAARCSCTPCDPRLDSSVGCRCPERRTGWRTTGSTVGFGSR